MCENGMVLVVGNVVFTSEELPVICAPNVREVDHPGCVVVVGDEAEFPVIRRALAVLINGDIPRRLPAERIGGIQLITCGRCGKNTVSITSDSGDTLTIALNRPVLTLDGTCEPLESPVQRSGSDFTCMAGFAAGILLNQKGAP